MSPILLILTIAGVGLLCLILAFFLCACKMSKNADEQAERMYNEADYYAHNGSGGNNDKH